MKQKIIPILVLSLVTIIIVVMLFFPPPWNKEIEGCTDATCSNYNPNATIDDGSCEDKELPHAIKEIIDKLAERSWDRQHYLQSKTNIGQYYHANSKSGTTEEENALHELKLVYMTVLNKETERIVDNCFEDDDKDIDISHFGSFEIVDSRDEMRIRAAARAKELDAFKKKMENKN